MFDGVLNTPLRGIYSCYQGLIQELNLSGGSKPPSKLNLMQLGILVDGDAVILSARGFRAKPFKISIFHSYISPKCLTFSQLIYPLSSRMPSCFFRNCYRYKIQYTVHSQQYVLLPFYIYIYAFFFDFGHPNLSAQKRLLLWNLTCISSCLRELWF